MSTQDREFLELLRETFKVEAAEHLQAIASGLLALEQAPAQPASRELVETVFRAAHSLKGAARAVDFSQIETLCQSLEDTFAVWKRENSVPSAATLDALHGMLDAINAALLDGPTAAVRSAAPRPLFAAPERPVKPPEERRPAVEDRPGAEPAERIPAPSRETVRVAVAKLDARLVDAEEMLTVKLITGQRAQDLRTLEQRVAAWKNRHLLIEPQARALRQAIDRSPGDEAGGQREGVLRLLDFIDWNFDQLKALENRLAALNRTAENDGQIVGRLVDDLLEDTKKLLLLPFATLAAPLPKLVRDLCRDQGKEAELKVVGEEVEIDKRIAEEIGYPLLHLLRNSIDHGIEAPEERRRRGKPSRATITLAASRVNGSKVQLLLSDDGAGIDTAKVRAAALKRGLVTAEAASRLDENEAQALIFQSDLSTSPIITQLSGRGLGLAIVREHVEKLGGEISLESRLGAGTSFRIVVPATRATFRGVLVEAGGQVLVVPSAQVDRVARIVQIERRSVEGRETVALGGRAVPVVRLADALELPDSNPDDAAAEAVPAVVLGAGDERVAFVVDAVLDELEVLVKPLARPLSRVRNVAAATVLGSGHVAPILHVGDLLKTVRRLSVPVRRANAAKVTDARRILVADDSITSRMLIKGILESAGYQVQTAFDGMEALALLRSDSFDLVVSDVEMPRLNGFDLTSRIRADEKLAQIPVVLVTALETPRDRERGIDAGATAYIVKRSFDQSNLLEIVQRLV